MDDEDLRDAEESRQLQTSETFTGFGTEHDGRHRDALMDLFRPAGETVGTKLLRKMGWNDGSKIGSDSPSPAETLSTMSIRPKTDRKGLGFEERDSGPSTATKPKSPNASQERRDGDGRRSIGQSRQKAAFGVGVLNDTGSDDEDPYSIGPQISYNRVIGGDKKSKKKTPSSVTTANPALKTKPVFLSKKLSSLQGALRKCHDGRLPLDGFVLDDDLEAMASLSLQNERYKPPDVPADWSSSLTPTESKPEEQDLQSVSEAAKSSTLDARSRASLLGEAQLPGKSVFDYISPAARDRLAQASGKANLPRALGEKPPNRYQTFQASGSVDLQELVPKLDQDVALQALSRGHDGWMPYSEDRAKRERYQTYLEIRAGFRASSEGDELPPCVPGMTQEAWVQEMQEFARAAQVFKPVTGEIASRFTSSTSNAPPSSNPDQSMPTESLLSRPKAKPEDPAEAAARMGMFGPMTRSIVNFYPTRLVCKRFSVPMPEHTDIPQSAGPRFTPDSAASMSTSRFESAGFQENEKEDPGLSFDQAQSGEAGVVKLAGDARSPDPIETAVDPERNEVLEQEKPDQALFKAIFGSDDEDDDEDM